MSLSDIFTPSVVISLAISVLLIGLLGLYVSNKLNEQNHKLNTMFDLVSTLAGELQMVRGHSIHGVVPTSIGGGQMYENKEAAAVNTNHLVNMIDVSDNSDSSEDESDDDSDCDSDDDGDDESDGNSDGDSDVADESDSDGEEDVKPSKVLVMSESLEESHFEELAELDDIILKNDKEESVKEIGSATSSSSVKNLNVVFDYKKASINKLREIVEQKGLSNDTSKLKKHDLLKLLDIE
jgi:hypothetical protein